MEHIVWADRGQLLQPDPAQQASYGLQVAVSRLGSVQMAETGMSIWLQVRGSSWVESREGRFRLRRGDWIALDRESRPAVQSDRHGLCIGLVLTSAGLREANTWLDGGLHTGRGTAGPQETRTAMRLWQQVAATQAAAGALRPLLLHIELLQRDLSAAVTRCPGRLRSRKRQVFARLQRAYLYLEGNCDRVVRISELAELTSFSSWYFSKTFHSVYGESPQAAAARLRLERAADLLRSSSLMIGEVAAASGFDNPCSFARAFRASFGVSATRYRRGPGGAAGVGVATMRAESAKPTGVTRKAA